MQRWQGDSGCAFITTQHHCDQQADLRTYSSSVLKPSVKRRGHKVVQLLCMRIPKTWLNIQNWNSALFLQQMPISCIKRNMLTEDKLSPDVWIANAQWRVELWFIVFLLGCLECIHLLSARVPVDLFTVKVVTPWMMDVHNQLFFKFSTNF